MFITFSCEIVLCTILSNFRVCTENGHVSYIDLVQHLNWRDSPIAPMQYQPVTADEGWTGNKASNVVSKIQYQPLLDDIFGKQTNNWTLWYIRDFTIFCLNIFHMLEKIYWMFKNSVHFSRKMETSTVLKRLTCFEIKLW